MALPRISRGLALPSGRTTTVTPTDAETDGDDDETREVPIPVPPDVSEEEVQEAADAAAEALPEDTEAVVGERDPEPEPSPEPDDMQRTIEQLRSTGDPNEVERTPVLESGNLDVAPDEWQLGFPLQGIPRLAAVLNLNYIYSEERGRWERDTGNRQAVGKTVIAEGTTLVLDGFAATETVDERPPEQILDDTDSSELRVTVVPTSGGVEFYNSGDQPDIASNEPLRYFLRRNSSGNPIQTELVFENDSGTDLDARFAVVAE